MTSNPPLKLELGATAAFTVGIAFKSVEDRIKKNTRVLESIYAGLLSLRNGGTPASQGSFAWLGELRPYLQATLNLLEQQVVALGQFRQQQVSVAVDKAAPPATEVAPERDNLKVIEDLPVLGEALKISRALLLPTQISAQFQKITRDIAISAGGADGADPSAQEQAIIAKVAAITEATGMERNQAAELIKQLFDTGMGLDKALDFAPATAKFSVGQDVSAKEAARLVGEVQKNPRVRGPDELEKALEHIVFQRKGTGEGVADSLSASQNQGLDQALDSKEPSKARGVLDRDLVARRGTSDQRLTEASNAVDESLRSLGDSMRPLTDGLAETVTGTAKAFTGAPDAIKWLIAGATVLGTTFLALKGGEAAKGVLSKGLEWLKGKPTSVGAADDPGQGSDLSNVNVLNDPLNVFVVNASDMGCCVRKPGQRRKPSRNGRKAPQGRTSQRRAPQRQPRSTTRRAPSPRAPAPGPSTPQPAPPPSPVGTAGKIGAAIKGVRGPALLTAGINTVATFMTADTPEEKAEGYGAAAGGLVGSVIGGVVGSFVPVIGTSIGAVLGGMAGEAIGGWLGKRMVSSDQEAEPADKQDQSSKPVAAQPGDVARSLASAMPASDALQAPIKPTGEGIAQPQSVTQQFTFTPSMPITVQGSVTDPALLAQNLQALVRREFEELMRMATSRQLSDVPHVYV
ncbi:hypothetical protein [Pseudomonas sp. LF19]|uniref:hypothetical protein n=1 Tax=Pseudomonas sp. LF19 TaxID=2899115 RepID=UPI001F2FD24F|nr:hypothetical protein [Pseudomonas sp. LF19]MCE5980476.1 hypothetical protein [Pseudomonas sp. LF19]